MLLLGCSIEEFKIYIESKFTEWMTWDNYGKFSIKVLTWHIDHIKPCDAFDLTLKEEQLKCFHYTNFQLLQASENLSKGAQYEIK